MMTHLALLLTILLVLTGCKLPSIVPMTSGALHAPAQASAKSLGGKVDWGSSVQAFIDKDIAPGATIALMDPETGYTLATTVTAPDGSFNLQFTDGFAPVDGRAYTLEAFKGIQGGNQDFNQAGADSVRVRTLVFFQAEPLAWKSLMNAEPGPVTISKRTTALAVAIALKKQAGQTITIADFIGAAAPDPYVPVGGLSLEAFTQVYDIVSDSIDQDRDPVHYVTYNSDTGEFLNSYVSFHLNTTVVPSEGPVGTSITLTGQGFDAGSATPSVSVNGIPATLVSVTSTQIVATVAPGSRTGPVSVKIGSFTQSGPTFKVLFSDGHRSQKDGKLYAVNPSWKTLVEVSPDGSVKTLATFTSMPRQAILGPDGWIYVSGQSPSKIMKVDPANPADIRTVNSTVVNPYGLAFGPDDRLYVTSQQAVGSVAKLDALGAIATTFTGFAMPTLLAFDPEGNLFVGEEAGTLTKITPAGANGAPRTPWGAVNAPKGLAVDPAGDLFVSSNTNHLIYRISRLRAMSTFAAINRPGSLTLDDLGNLYVADTHQNVIRRISPLGDTETYAYGITSPRGLAIEPTSGDLFVSLNQTNAILRVIPSTGVVKPFVKGIAKPLTLTFGNNGLFIAHPESKSVTFADLNGQLSTIANNLDDPSGVERADDGTFYFGRWGLGESGIGASVGGFHKLSGNTLTTHFAHERGGLEFLAIDNEGAYLGVNADQKELLRIVPKGNSFFEITRIATFAQEPGWVQCDAAGNVYVAVSAENAVYRFDKAAGYAATPITGFNKPWGLTFDDLGRLFVSNQGGTGTLRRVTTPATAPAADAWDSVALGTDIKGIVFLGGDIFVAKGTKTIDRYSVAGNSVAAYLTTLPSNIQHLFTKGGELYAAASASSLYRIDAGKQIYPWPGTLQAFDASGGAHYDSSGGGLTSPTENMGHLQTGRELALDGNRLFVASPSRGNSHGTVFWTDLDTGKQYQSRAAGGEVHSLAISANHDLYAGSTSKVYRINPVDGTSSAPWSPNTTIFGLDIRSEVLWGVGDNNRIYEMPIGGALVTYYFGLMEPSF
jgi:streptogramin lyase